LNQFNPIHKFPPHFLTINQPGHSGDVSLFLSGLYGFKHRPVHRKLWRWGVS
jgi:hypothetical protein